jgi:hypothetical protein
MLRKLRSELKRSRIKEKQNGVAIIAELSELCAVVPVSEKPIIRPLGVI